MAPFTEAVGSPSRAEAPARPDELADVQGRAPHDRAAAAYDSIADWYASFVRHGSPIHEVVLPCVLELAGQVDGQRVCDLACGEGIVARALAGAGASVVAVDISHNLLRLAIAADRQEPLGISYVLDDAQHLDRLDDASFDGVVSNLALTDIPRLPSAMAAIARILKPGGWFVFSVNHPCGPVSAREGHLLHTARNYFTEGYWLTPNPDSVRGRVGAYHRMLSSYLNSACAAGLVLEACIEPQATGALATYAPGFDRVPVALVLRCRKPE
jgi:ubiquinone/menaquinone biosynthesis C-methylase UbiE